MRPSSRVEQGETYEPRPGHRVLAVTYGCRGSVPDRPVHSDEHDAVGLFAVAEIGDLALPGGYRRSIH